MSGSTYQLCSIGNITISDSMTLDRGCADSGADKHTVVNLNPADELLTGDRSADHPKVDMSQDAETGSYMPEIPVIEPSSEVISDTNPQEGDPIILPEFAVLDEEHLHKQPELTSAQLSTIQQAEALIPNGTKEVMDRYREAIESANQPVPSSSPDARPQDKGKIVNYCNKLAMLPGFTSNDFDVNSQHQALSFWEALQNESTESGNTTVVTSNGTAINEPSMEKIPSQLTTAQKTLKQHRAHSVEISEGVNAFHTILPSPSVVLEQLAHLNQPLGTAASIALTLPQAQTGYIVYTALHLVHASPLVTTPMVESS
ncbi:uncharacterized protein BT62DRAFT_920519 [Guyanagaster necrorhizus]|uniref:Uncharacterized protein n=1 Tax=Guyanagaster necrorhizus TaxID=856835 RepID=A0A9P7VQW0_9AGAR|nr:uncharacterized protein BT62DRAFT_920519 [Guyanagaster necrorhizus MCA 3950]KAG7445239.1 hypothetical protein BT62DRAFT_920519 [Guyanagaster necrorhizus MCA 3950]